MKAKRFSRDQLFMRDQFERTEAQRTRRRRDDQSRRRQLYWAIGAGLLAMLVLGAPSLVSHSSIGRSIVLRTAASYGWDAQLESMRVGWLTPLRLDGLQLRGQAAGTEISVQQLDTELTITRLISSSLSDLGQLSARGVVLAMGVSDGGSTLEQDLAPMLEGPSTDTVYTARVDLQDIGVMATDLVSRQAWKLAQSNAEVELGADAVSAQFAGVLTEPRGNGGALQGSVAMSLTQESESPAWQVRLQCESLPISTVALAKRRLGTDASSIPESLSGDSTGRVSIDGFQDGRVVISPERLEVRNFAASDPSFGGKSWSNGLAAMDGVLIIEPMRIVGRNFQINTDFAAAQMNGAVSTAITFAGSRDNPVLWLDALDGIASAEIDLALMDRALPGMLPLRPGTEILSGKVLTRVDTLPGDNAVRRSQLTLESQTIRARAAGQGVVIEPVQCVAVVVRDGGRVAAEKFQWNSSFASATGSGDTRSGSAKLEIDFGRLASTLRPIIDLSEKQLAGLASGNVRWSVSPDRMWRLEGSGQASDMQIQFPSGQRFSRPSLRADVRAVGQWDGQQLSELSEARLTVTSNGINLAAELARLVKAPTPETLLPLRIQGTGRVESLVEMFGPWLPSHLQECQGGFDLTAQASVAADRGELRQMALELVEPKVVYQDRAFTQPNLKVLFDGQYAWPSNALIAKSLTVKGEAVSAAVQGELVGDKAQLEVAWKAKLERVQGSVEKRVASRPNAVTQSVAFRPTAEPTDQWIAMGDIDGKLAISTKDAWWHIDCHTSGKNLALLQPSSATGETVGPMPRQRSASPSAQASPPRVVWSEPNFRLDGNILYHPISGEVRSDDMQVSGDWFAAKLGGRVVSKDGATDVQLRGPGKLKMDEVGQLLTKLSSTNIAAVGVHETPLDISMRQLADGTTSMNINASLGWESATVAGVAIGPSSIPVRMTETTLFISPSIVPLLEGEINLAGEVHYRPGPIWMRVAPGRFARSVRLTREMNQRWLKYLAPVAADAANIDGRLGVTFDEAIIVLDSPAQSRVVGRLDVDGVEMTAGPLSNQIIGGIEQLKSIARGQLPQGAATNTKTLVTMPAQTVDFKMIDGIVSHERLLFQVDRAQVWTSGRVALDGRLNMVAQVPLDARWLGRDLQGLTGQSVSLPIDGTLSRPSLDSAGVRQVITQLGSQAVQGAAENYLQQQFNRGLDKIFGN